MRAILGTLILGWAALAAAQTVPQTPAERDLSLREAVELATRLSPRIQMANLRTLEARGQYGVVRSGYLPQLTARASETRQTSNLRGIGLTFPGVPARIGPFTTFDARPAVTQTVFDYSLIQSMAAARKRIQTADFDAQSLRETTLLGVVDLYLRTLQSQTRLEATEARLRTAKALAKQARDFLEVGTGNRLDLRRAESQLETETAAQAQQRRDVETTRLLLLQTIGLPVETPVRLTEKLTIAAPPVAGPEDAVSVALERRPEAQAARAAIDAARFSVRSAKAQRLPRVTFSADYGVVGQQIDRNLSTYAVRGALEVPIFQGGRIQAETHIEKSRLQQAEEELRDVENLVRLDLRTAEIQLDAARIAAGAASRAGEAADESVELARLRFEAGITSNIDVIQAQQEQARADELEIQTLYDFYLARANFAKALGDVAAFLP